MTKVDTDIMFKLSITPGVPETYEIQIFIAVSQMYVYWQSLLTSEAGYKIG